MEYYKDIVREKFEDLKADEKAESILARWSDGRTGDDFGNLSGSRTFSTWQAEQDLAKAGFPFDDEIVSELESVGYNVGELIKRGAEIVDVILCELAVPYVVAELKDESEV